MPPPVVAMSVKLRLFLARAAQKSMDSADDEVHDLRRTLLRENFWRFLHNSNVDILSLQLARSLAPPAKSATLPFFHLSQSPRKRKHASRTVLWNKRIGFPGFADARPQPIGLF